MMSDLKLLCLESLSINLQHPVMWDVGGTFLIMRRCIKELCAQHPFPIIRLYKTKVSSELFTSDHWSSLGQNRGAWSTSSLDWHLNFLLWDFFLNYRDTSKSHEKPVNLARDLRLVLNKVCKTLLIRCGGISHHGAAGSRLQSDSFLRRISKYLHYSEEEKNQSWKKENIL